MKWIFTLLLCFVVGSARAQSGGGSADEYVSAYRLIDQADAQASAQPKEAVEKYVQAQTILKQVQAEAPGWNKDLVQFRLDYLAGKISGLASYLPKPGEAAVTNAAPATATAPADQAQAVTFLQDQLRAATAANEDLQKRLKEALSIHPAAASPRDLAKAQEQVLALQKERDLLAAQLSDAKKTAIPTGGKKAASDSEAKKLTADLEKAEKQLGEANKQLAAARKQLVESDKALTDAKAAAKKQAEEAGRQLADAKASGRKSSSSKGGNSEVESLKARLAVLEAAAVPYSAEEQALLKKSAGQTGQAPMQTASSGTTPARGAHNLPTGTATMVAEAQRAMLERDYNTAITKYQEVLRQDDKNVFVLGHLAMAQFAAGKVDDCEKNATEALKINRNDAACLYLLGNLRLRQNKLDEALDDLSRSAQIDPTNAITQNSLGIVLGQKGQRSAAETALRKALLLEPEFADAHHNLAVVYAGETPPSLELARWHYKKALDEGMPKDPDLEKILNP